MYSSTYSRGKKVGTYDPVNHLRESLNLLTQDHTKVVGCIAPYFALPA